MPLFTSRRHSDVDENIAHSEAKTEQANHETSDETKRRGGIFRSRNSPPPETTPPARRHSFLARFREHPSRSLNEDPAIKSAKQKVTDAEHAERDADKALEMARNAVRAARRHVKELEEAALEEAKRARAKQREAKSIRKGADRLGRHDNH